MGVREWLTHLLGGHTSSVAATPQGAVQAAEDLEQRWRAIRSEIRGAATTIQNETALRALADQRLIAQARDDLQRATRDLQALRGDIERALGPQGQVGQVLHTLPADAVLAGSPDEVAALETLAARLTAAEERLREAQSEIPRLAREVKAGVDAVRYTGQLGTGADALAALPPHGGPPSIAEIARSRVERALATERWVRDELRAIAQQAPEAARAYEAARQERDGIVRKGGSASMDAPGPGNPSGGPAWQAEQAKKALESLAQRVDRLRSAIANWRDGAAPVRTELANTIVEGNLPRTKLVEAEGEADRRFGELHEAHTPLDRLDDNGHLAAVSDGVGTAAANARGENAVDRDAQARMRRTLDGAVREAEAPVLRGGPGPRGGGGGSAGGGSADTATAAEGATGTTTTGTPTAGGRTGTSAAGGTARSSSAAPSTEGGGSSGAADGARAQRGGTPQSAAGAAAGQLAEAAHAESAAVRITRATSRLADGVYKALGGPEHREAMDDATIASVRVSTARSAAPEAVSPLSGSTAG